MISDTTTRIAPVIGNHRFKLNRGFACVFVATASLFSATREGSAQEATVLGVQTCQKCHETEVMAWAESPHAKAAYANLSHEKAGQFASAMGISGSLGDSMCADCHDTEPAGSPLHGASCEACHNPAGPDSKSVKESGWFQPHFNFGVEFDGDGSPIALRDQESEARRERRVKFVKQRGMIRSDDAYEIAMNCLACHTVPNERLVNAGHPVSKRFELVRWSQGVVRHNFALDQTKNAEAPSLWLNPIPKRPNRTSENRNKLMFVTGQLADLEFSLRQRAAASEGDFGKAFSARVEDAIDELEDVKHIAEVNQALEAVAGVDRKSLRKYGAAQKELFNKAADGVATAAAAFVKNHPDGDDLGKVKPPRRSEGDPYNP